MSIYADDYADLYAADPLSGEGGADHEEDTDREGGDGDDWDGYDEGPIDDAADAYLWNEDAGDF
jgi:hypothetical protein